MVFDKKPRFSEQERENVKKALRPDYIVYDYALQKLRNQIADAGSEFMDEITDFKAVIQKVSQFCDKDSGAKTLTVDASKWHGSFTLTRELCETFQRKEKDYITILRKKQYGAFRKT